DFSVRSLTFQEHLDRSTSCERRKDLFPLRVPVFSGPALGEDDWSRLKSITFIGATKTLRERFWRSAGKILTKPCSLPNKNLVFASGRLTWRGLTRAGRE